MIDSSFYTPCRQYCELHAFTASATYQAILGKMCVFGLVILLGQNINLNLNKCHIDKYSSQCLSIHN